MKRILAILAVSAFAPVAVLAQGFNTTGGYGNPVLDTKGAAFVNTNGLKASYVYQGADLTPYASATDYITLTGSATRTIRLSQVCFGGDATAATIQDFYIYKRTVADTGGTSTAGTVAQYDSTDPAPTAAIAVYSVAPTTGTGVLIRGGHITVPNATTPAGQAGWICWQFGNGEELPTLRGVAQQIAINHNGTVASGLSAYYTVEWTEE